MRWPTTGRRRVLAAGLAGGLLLAAAAWPHAPRLVWNATASAPLGLYGLIPHVRLARGDWAAARPPAAAAAWLDRADRLPRGALLVKRVAAVEGRRVCRVGAWVWIDGRRAARARARDLRGLALPAWRGCRRLAAGEVLLLNPHPDSLDGRYLGPSRASELVGRLRPLWTWDAPGATP